MNIASAIAAFIAALLWFASASVRIPPITAVLLNADGSIQRPPHEAALTRQSAFSAFAAAAAGIAALLQGLSIQGIQMPATHWLTLASAVSGAAGTVFLYLGMFGFEPLQMFFWSGSQINQSAVDRNIRRQWQQRIGLALLLAAFVMQGVSDFI